MTFLLFIYLGAAQLTIGAFGAAVALLLSRHSSLRQRRRSMIAGVLAAAVGGIIGVVAGFLFVVLALHACQTLQESSLVSGCGLVADLSIWALISGYVCGVLVGGSVGWITATALRTDAPGEA